MEDDLPRIPFRQGSIPSFGGGHFYKIFFIFTSILRRRICAASIAGWSSWQLIWLITKSTGVRIPLPQFSERECIMEENKLTDMYCPNCLRIYGRKKLLFQKKDGAKGEIEILCRGCRKIQDIKLDNEQSH